MMEIFQTKQGCLFKTINNYARTVCMLRSSRSIKKCLYVYHFYNLGSTDIDMNSNMSTVMDMGHDL